MSGETEKAVSGWTVDTLHAHVQRQLDDMRKMLDERYQTQTKAVDAAFLAQQTAMTTALAAAERAVATALQSAEKAVSKAEVAQEKRLESVNEFRGQLSDQAATFVRRDDVDTRIASLIDKFDSEARRTAEALALLNARMDKHSGIEAGQQAQIVEGRAGFSAAYAGIAAVIGLVLFAITLYGALKK